LGALPRPFYAYCAIRGSELATRLGYREVTWVEFGVAGGNGLLALEQIKQAVEAQLPIKVHITGFDLGSGLPTPQDYRDLPYHWQGGFYEMDVDALRSRLRHAQLALGPVAETLPKWTPAAPIGMVSFDLDYYSSTLEALKIFDQNVLPRVWCYFDDIAGTAEAFSDYTGVRLAVHEYNQGRRKLSACHDFELYGPDTWHEKIMIHHDFDHPRYTEFVGVGATQIPLM